MLLALARNHKRSGMARPASREFLQQTRDIRTFSLTPEQYREFSRQAKDKVLFAVSRTRSSRTRPLIWSFQRPIWNWQMSFSSAFSVRSKAAGGTLAKKGSRSERSSDDTGSSSPTSRKSSKNDRPSVGEQLQSFREKAVRRRTARPDQRKNIRKIGISLKQKH